FYIGFPVTLVSLANAYLIFSEHYQHLQEHPKKYEPWPYHIYNKPYPWGLGRCQMLLSSPLPSSLSLQELTPALLHRRPHAVLPPAGEPRPGRRITAPHGQLAAHRLLVKIQHVNSGCGQVSLSAPSSSPTPRRRAG